eukprot:GHRR01032733.1.p1 GENE.GHRR01032733.1~~GHRR01032733.1.p1  ORF type:complete len:101 (-),score=21.35 GHRR01032733.1:333-635(-)
MPSAQHVMLAIHVKRTDNIELKNPILSYIREQYGDRDAEDCVDDLAAIQTLRNEIVTSQAGSQLIIKDTYIKWVQLLFGMAGQYHHPIIATGTICTTCYD